MKINTEKLRQHDTRDYFPMWAVAGLKFQASPTPGFRPVMGFPYPLAFVVGGWTFYCKPEIKQQLLGKLLELGIIYPEKGGER